MLLFLSMQQVIPEVTGRVEDYLFTILDFINVILLLISLFSEYICNLITCLFTVTANREIHREPEEFTHRVFVYLYNISVYLSQHTTERIT